MYVLDTCALVWWTLDPDRLSDPAAEACRRIESEGGGLVSAISIWETGIKIRNGELDLGMPVRAFHALVLQMQTIEFVPVDDVTWLENVSLEWDHRDPADRTIVALSRLRNLPLLTSDDVIRRFHPNTIW